MQWNASLALGAARYGDEDDLWRTTRFAASARTDFFFGRSGNQSFGFGPGLFAGVTTFGEASIGASAQVLLPVHELLPIVVGLGLYGVDREAQKARAGGYATLGWGLRSFNYHSTYAMAGGLLFEARRDFSFSEAPVTTWMASLQLDAAALALPVVWAINAFR
ncbi:MAG TPA: hypothetical protein VFS43_41965 [Polyangiaceae bacterium]|nr:hypothetical protein [Polyangiaceae bacterium]